jgi:hypothetical protein
MVSLEWEKVVHILQQFYSKLRLLLKMDIPQQLLPLHELALIINT